MTTTRDFIAISLAVAAMGCASSGPAETTGFGVAPLMTVHSQSGQLTIDVRSSPHPPVRGTNDVELTITGSTDGGPVDGLAIGVKPWMPTMGHGTSIVPTIAPEMNGKYLVSGVDLYMPGLWQLRLTISGPMQDNAAPAFEIQ
jgi:hypothetical protein